MMYNFHKEYNIKQLSEVQKVEGVGDVGSVG